MQCIKCFYISRRTTNKRFRVVETVTKESVYFLIIISKTHWYNYQAYDINLHEALIYACKYFSTEAVKYRNHVINYADMFIFSFTRVSTFQQKQWNIESRHKLCWHVASEVHEIFGCCCFRKTWNLRLSWNLRLLLIPKYTKSSVLVPSTNILSETNAMYKMFAAYKNTFYVSYRLYGDKYLLHVTYGK
jgi:hypothetical protein